MPNVTVFLHRSVKDYLDHLASNILDASRSETVETMLRYIFNEDLESEVWENYDDRLEEFEKEVEEYEDWAKDNLPEDAEDESETEDELEDLDEEEKD